MNQNLYRRNFLRFVAASPLIQAAFGADAERVIKDPKEALSILDFEAAAKLSIPVAHLGYMNTGVDDDKTLRANREGFDRLYLRPRRFVDVSKVDMAQTLFGQQLDVPIVLAPCGSQKAFHAEGELATARAAHSGGFQQILSTNTSAPIEEVAKAHVRPLWYQLYPTDRWQYTENLVRHAEAVGSTALFLTVDTQGGRNTETEARTRLNDQRPCASCHPVGKVASVFSRPKPMYNGFDLVGMSTQNAAQTWDVIAKMRQLTKMKLIIKGIETSEDATRCAELGVDGIVVSNHGARAVESNRGTIDCLPEIAEAVGRRTPILIDGGFRRGTDIFKALALGASAVLVGRPYLWALGAFGEAGVARALTILRSELLLSMRQCGTPTLGQITRSHVGLHAR